MIAHHAGFIAGAAHPATLGGLVGSMFFAGYMLTQYPGGRLGDRYGHREMIVVSLLWAGVLTVLSGAFAGLLGFVAVRVLTGLAEGVFYSNDRTLIMRFSPPDRRTLGLGVAITGLAIGLTLGLVATAPLMAWGSDTLALGGDGWRVPFVVFGAVASPVVSGLLRDSTGSWAPGVFVAAALMVAAVLLWLPVRERPAVRPAPAAAPAPAPTGRTPSQL